METDKLVPVIESPDMDVATVEPIVTQKRKVAHVHKADRRANQYSPINDGGKVGRQRDEECFETTYHVKNPGGFKINEKLYRGRVTVPECIANYLCQMDNDWARVEVSLFRNNPTSLHYDVGR